MHGGSFPCNEAGPALEKVPDGGRRLDVPMLHVLNGSDQAKCGSEAHSSEKACGAESRASGRICRRRQQLKLGVVGDATSKSPAPSSSGEAQVGLEIANNIVVPADDEHAHRHLGRRGGKRALD